MFFSLRVPATVCFGHGSVRGFRGRRGRRKWNTRIEPSFFLKTFFQPYFFAKINVSICSGDEEYLLLVFVVYFSAPRLSLQKKMRRYNVWDAVDLLVWLKKKKLFKEWCRAAQSDVWPTVDVDVSWKILWKEKQERNVRIYTIDFNNSIKQRLTHQI